MKLNDTTRKFPRTMEQAFGRGTSQYLEDNDPKYDWQDAVVVTACAIAALAAMFILFFWEVAP